MRSHSMSGHNGPSSHFTVARFHQCEHTRSNQDLQPAIGDWFTGRKIHVPEDTGKLRNNRPSERETSQGRRVGPSRALLPATLHGTTHWHLHTGRNNERKAS